MKYRLLVLLAAAGAGLAAPVVASAMPLHLNPQAGTAQVLLVDDDGDDDESWSDDHDDHGNRKGHDDCDAGDDDDDDCGSAQGAAPQNANPPANGLITPGSKPQVKIN